MPATTSKRSSWFVDVQRAGHAAAGRQLEVDGDELAVRARGGLAERDALAARRVLDGLSWICHASRILADGRTVHDRSALMYAQSSNEPGRSLRPTDPLGEALAILRMNGAFYARPS